MRKIFMKIQKQLGEWHCSAIFAHLLTLGLTEDSCILNTCFFPHCGGQCPLSDSHWHISPWAQLWENEELSFIMKTVLTSQYFYNFDHTDPLEGSLRSSGVPDHTLKTASSDLKELFSSLKERWNLPVIFYWVGLFHVRVNMRTPHHYCLSSVSASAPSTTLALPLRWRGGSCRDGKFASVCMEGNRARTHWYLRQVSSLP